MKRHAKGTHANPTVAKFPRDLAWSHHSVGLMLSETGKPIEALSAHQKALVIRQKLAEAVANALK